jgi:hypothetical protein
MAAPGRCPSPGTAPSPSYAYSTTDLLQTPRIRRARSPLRLSVGLGSADELRPESMQTGEGALDLRVRPQLIIDVSGRPSASLHVEQDPAFQGRRLLCPLMR